MNNIQEPLELNQCSNENPKISTVVRSYSINVCMSWLVVVCIWFLVSRFSSQPHTCHSHPRRKSKEFLACSAPLRTAWRALPGPKPTIAEEFKPPFLVTHLIKVVESFHKLDFEYSKSSLAETFGLYQSLRVFNRSSITPKLPCKVLWCFMTQNIALKGKDLGLNMTIHKATWNPGRWWQVALCWRWGFFLKVGQKQLRLAQRKTDTGDQNR